VPWIDARVIALAALLACAAPAAAELRAHAGHKGHKEPIVPHGKRDGLASFYGSSKSKALTAAHRTLPFGTEVRVTNKKNGKTVVVRINDRGPFIKGRIIDVSHAAARALGMISSGLAPVRLTIVAPPKGFKIPEKHKARDD
jgi:rare lipoprotein A